LPQRQGLSLIKLKNNNRLWESNKGEIMIEKLRGIALFLSA